MTISEVRMWGETVCSQNAHTNKILEGINSNLREKIKRIVLDLESHGFKPLVHNGIRTKEEQVELVKQGYSQTMKSAHLNGLAVDIVEIDKYWDVSYIDTFCIALGKAYEDEGLVWGGVWKKGNIRWPILNRCVENKTTKPITWFYDWAHGEMNL